MATPKSFSLISAIPALDVRRFINLFPRSKWIHFYREDIYSQAISFWKAKKTNQWHVYNKKDLSRPGLEYNFDEILECFREIGLHDQMWREFYRRAGLIPTMVKYEDLMDDTELHLGKALHAIRGVSDQPVITGSEQVIQRDEESHELLSKFMAGLFSTGF